MKQQIGVDRLLQRGLERIDQPVGKIPNEAHRVGHRNGSCRLRAVQLPRRGVQRGEKLIRCVRALAFTKALKRVDLPALVYPTSEILKVSRLSR